MDVLKSVCLNMFAFRHGSFNDGRELVVPVCCLHTTDWFCVCYCFYRATSFLVQNQQIMSKIPCLVDFR